MKLVEQLLCMQKEPAYGRNCGILQSGNAEPAMRTESRSKGDRDVIRAPSIEPQAFDSLYLIALFDRKSSLYRLSIRRTAVGIRDLGPYSAFMIPI